jgi:hypothetical protein
MDIPFTRDNSSGSSPQDSASGNNDLVSRSAARAALSFLERNGSRAPEQVQRQIEALYTDLLRDLGHNDGDGTIVMTPDQLRGVIAGAVITGAAQVAMERNVAFTDAQIAPAPTPVEDLNQDNTIAGTLEAS